VNTTKGINLEYTLHSPLVLSFVDTNGNIAGFGADAQHTIVGAHYARVGEVQWLSVPKGIAGTLVLKGITDGSFTLDISEKDGGTILSTTSFAGIPSAASTTVKLPVSATSSPTASSILSIDYDSNGVVDTTLVAQPNTLVQNTAKVPLFVTPQNTRMTLGGTVPSFISTFSGFVGNDTPLHHDVTGAPVCTTTATPGSAVGIYPITCTAGTLSSNVYSFTFATGTLQVVYRVDGIQAKEDDSHPLWNLATATPVFERGERIALSIQPKRNDGTVQQSIKIPIWFVPVQGGTLKMPASNTPVVSSPTTAVMVWDSKKKQYTYTWDTRPLKAGYWYRIGLKLDDGVVYTGVIGLK